MANPCQFFGNGVDHVSLNGGEFTAINEDVSKQLNSKVKFESSEVYGTVMCGMATSLEIALYCWFGNEAELKVQLLPKRES